MIEGGREISPSESIQPGLQSDLKGGAVQRTRSSQEGFASLRVSLRAGEGRVQRQPFRLRFWISRYQRVQLAR